MIDRDYEDFLATKTVTVPVVGFTVDQSTLPQALFPWQREVVAWALHLGRSALFEDCGLGKTLQQLAWADAVCKQTGGNVLILAPLGVVKQTVAEAERFGLHATACRTRSDVRPGINVTNYDMFTATNEDGTLKHFDPTSFVGVVLDESSILKSFMGKTKELLLAAFAATPYRLACTATPAPNDHMELGNHAEFLGIMPGSEMLMRWFINDTMHFGRYRLKGYAEQDYWDWVASWAVSVQRPSDLGYSDEGYNLPPLHMHQHTVDADITADTDGKLMRMPDLNATGLHKELRRTAPARAAAAAALVNNSAESWIVWCNTNYEADELMRRIPGAVELRGSETASAKERKLDGFASGTIRVLVTKPSLAGFGLNWQHCHNAVFVGLSYSFEQFYQALRRNYRFGQQHPVQAHVIIAETEGPIFASIQAKMQDHAALQAGLRSSRYTLSRAHGRAALTTSAGNIPMIVPAWLSYGAAA